MTPSPVPALLSLASPSVFKPESALTSEPVPGVYLLHFEDRVVYVGQSGNIPERLRTHRKEATKRFEKATWFPLETLSDRLRLEGILCLELMPVHNNALLLRVSHGTCSEIRFRRKRRAAAW